MISSRVVEVDQLRRKVGKGVDSFFSTGIARTFQFVLQLVKYTTVATRTVTVTKPD